MEKRNFSQAPIPFMGQKRRFLNDFKAALKQFNDCPVFVDLFGGSGLLSHTVKQERPDATVIYNDFDDYHLRLENITRTNALIAELRAILVNEPKDKLIKVDIKAAILKRIKKEEKSGFVDYVTLSSSLLFSMNYANNYAELEKQSMYNCVRSSEYDCAGYLQGVEIVKKDYKELFEQYRHHPSVVFLVDPPYLSTESGTYTGYWKLGDYLDVLNILTHNSYFYFTSNKSHIVELCDWMERNHSASNPFAGSVRKEIVSRIGYNSQYVDIMMFKRVQR